MACSAIRLAYYSRYSHKIKSYATIWHNKPVTKWLPHNLVYLDGVQLALLMVWIHFCLLFFRISGKTMKYDACWPTKAIRATIGTTASNHRLCLNHCNEHASNQRVVMGDTIPKLSIPPIYRYRYHVSILSTVVCEDLA